MSDELTKTIQELAVEATELFYKMQQERHNAGAETYGPLKFMDANTLEEAMEEVVDIANYSLYTFIKLYILNKSVDRIAGDTPIELGPNSFIPSKAQS
jgi:hypothetical protein